MKAIHAAVKASLDRRVNTSVITPNAASSVSVTKGGTTGIAIVNAFYELGYRITRAADPLTMNVYARTGQDNVNHLPGVGTLTVRSFDIPNQVMKDDRVEFYNDTNYAVFEYYAEVFNSEVWIWTYERLRSDPTNQALARVCFLRSIDGLVGRAFAAPVVQTNISSTIYRNFHSTVWGSADKSIRYLMIGSGSPAGLRRTLVNQVTGELTNDTLMFSASGYTEGFALNVDNNGTIVDVNRLNSGGYLQQSISTDWGATWSAPVNTNIGAATGSKVTPSLMLTANRPGMLTTVFNDRGAGNRDRCSSLNTLASVLTAAWNATFYLGTPATQGNGKAAVFDDRKGLYLFVVAKEVTGPPDTTNLIYFVFQDNYTTYNVPPAPWQ